MGPKRTDPNGPNEPRRSKKMERVDKTNYYLDIAETILERGTCLRNNYGSVIVKNDEIISTGYSGAPRGRKNCLDLGYCIRKQKTDLSGQISEIKLVNNFIDAQIEDAKQEKDKNYKMYKTLGIVVGATIVIILA